MGAVAVGDGSCDTCLSNRLLFRTCSHKLLFLLRFLQLKESIEMGMTKCIYCMAPHHAFDDRVAYCERFVAIPYAVVRCQKSDSQQFVTVFRAD